MKTQLRKIKRNKGETDKGISYDYTRVTVEVPIYETDKEFGVDTIDLEFGTSADFYKLENLRGKLPALVEVEWETMKKGKNTVNVVTKLEVVQDKAKPQAQV